MSKFIDCTDCGSEFEFTEGEEKFYAEKGLYPPKRCKKCRKKKRQERERNNSSGGSRTYRPNN